MNEINIKAFTSEPKLKFQPALNSCIKEIKSYMKNSNITSKRILKQTIFFKSDNLKEYNSKKIKINNTLTSHLNTYPTTSFISQSPADGSEIIFELTILNNQNCNKFNIQHKKFKSEKYTVVQFETFKEIYYSESKGYKHNNLKKAVTNSFNKVNRILAKENMDFKNIARQWNYIEKITQKNNQENQTNYQTFNNIRTSFYKKSNLHSNYPAATGIGIKQGKVIIEIIANNLPEKNNKPISNPDQVDAHKYSKEILNTYSEKSTPKFERAKLILKPKTSQLLVSGTASIQGEQTVHKDKPIEQTNQTLKNISELTKQINFNLNQISYSRTYINNNENSKEIIKTINKELPKSDNIFIIADICRNNLIVETESYLEYQK